MLATEATTSQPPAVERVSAVIRAAHLSPTTTNAIRVRACDECRYRPRDIRCRLGSARCECLQFRCAVLQTMALPTLIREQAVAMTSLRGQLEHRSGDHSANKILTCIVQNCGERRVQHTAIRMNSTAGAQLVAELLSTLLLKPEYILW
jgi:hypothetical protein